MSSTTKPKLLLVTDFYFQAAGRNYYKEDLYLSEQLRLSFEVAICHPCDAVSFMDSTDVVLFRNAGPVMYFEDEFQAFVAFAKEHNVRVYNQLTGKADMRGKQYLLDLTKAGYPVIPTVDSLDELDSIPPSGSFVSKLKRGADSVGMEFINRAQVTDVDFQNRLLQPLVDFDYEVSFYFIDRQFQYALNAPDTSRRWQLQPYNATDADIQFAKSFIDWNTIDVGIQRIDACRMPDGRLLLMEIEDLNPYLSLDLIPEATRDKFITTLTASLLNLAQQPTD